MGKWHPSGCVIDQDHTVVGIEELSVPLGRLESYGSHCTLRMLA
jgi:hypothetical protein